MKNFTLKQSWKKVFAKDADETVSTLRTYHMNDEEETEVEKEDIVEGETKVKKWTVVHSGRNFTP